MKSARYTLQVHFVIVAIYAALAGWWVWFFLHEERFLITRLAAAGQPLSGAQAGALAEITAGTARMFLAESSFLLLLMLVSAWLLVRALRRELALARQQRNFLSAVTHELRSPIASARLYLETLLLRRAEPGREERYLRHAHEDLQRLGAMVEDLLEGRRLGEQGVELHRKPLDLAALVAGQLERLRQLHAGQGARIELDGPAPVAVQADAQACLRVLDNLVSNAVKYDGAQPRVRIEVRAEGGRALLTVRDHGPGLAGADPRRIFEPFVRGGDELVRTRPGVGLGLYIVRELVAAHGGRVSVQSELPDGGTAFRVELPLSVTAAAGSRAP